MRRKILIAVLALGTIGGFAAGFARLGRCHHDGHGYGWHHRQRDFERRVADVCVDAALRAQAARK
jgi:hypothetical protein